MTRHIQDGGSVKLTSRKCPNCQRPLPRGNIKLGYCCLNCLRGRDHDWRCDLREQHGINPAGGWLTG